MTNIASRPPVEFSRVVAITNVATSKLTSDRNGRPAYMLARILDINDSRVTLRDVINGNTRRLRASELVLHSLRTAGLGIYQLTVQDDFITGFAYR
jgi:hypothetical protein